MPIVIATNSHRIVSKRLVLRVASQSLDRERVFRARAVAFLPIGNNHSTDPQGADKGEDKGTKNKGAKNQAPSKIECDRFDDAYEQIMIEDRQSGQLMATFRIRGFECASQLAHSYSHQFFDLKNGYQNQTYPVLELGRLCIMDLTRNIEIMRFILGALTCWVDECALGGLFGVSSIGVMEPQKLVQFAHILQARYPSAFLPPHQSVHPHTFLQPNAPTPKKHDDQAVVALDQLAQSSQQPTLSDLRGAVEIPSLLGIYLYMGGKVGRSCVWDAHLGSYVLFTTLQIAQVPKQKAHQMRQAMHQEMEVCW